MIGQRVLKEHKIGQVYAQYIKAENDKNTQNRYVGKEHYYHASGAGTCSRKLYFQSVEKVEPTNLPNSTSDRVMRLGTVLHQEIENSLLFNNSNNNNIKNNITNTNITKYIESNEFVTEKEVIIEELSVRGFFDFLHKQGSRIFLYDLKSAAAYSFSKVFDTTKPYTMKHQELQLSTYGYAVKEEYGRLDGMYLMYYNKNTSVIKYKEVPLSMLNSAYMFWANINKQHSSGLPGFEDGVSPVMKWECDYCNFLEHCQPPANYGKYSDKHTIKVRKQ